MTVPPTCGARSSLSRQISSCLINASLPGRKSWTVPKTTIYTTGTSSTIPFPTPTHSPSPQTTMPVKERFGAWFRLRSDERRRELFIRKYGIDSIHISFSRTIVRSSKSFHVTAKFCQRSFLQQSSGMTVGTKFPGKFILQLFGEALEMVEPAMNERVCLEE